MYTPTQSDVKEEVILNVVESIISAQDYATVLVGDGNWEDISNGVMFTLDMQMLGRWQMVFVASKRLTTFRFRDERYRRFSQIGLEHLFDAEMEQVLLPECEEANSAYATLRKYAAIANRVLLWQDNEPIGEFMSSEVQMVCLDVIRLLTGFLRILPEAATKDAIITALFFGGRPINQTMVEAVALLERLNCACGCSFTRSLTFSLQKFYRPNTPNARLLAVLGPTSYAVTRLVVNKVKRQGLGTSKLAAYWNNGLERIELGCDTAAWFTAEEALVLWLQCCELKCATVQSIVRKATETKTESHISTTNEIVMKAEKELGLAPETTHIKLQQLHRDKHLSYTRAKPNNFFGASISAQKILEKLLGIASTHDRAEHLLKHKAVAIDRGRPFSSFPSHLPVHVIDAGGLEAGSIEQKLCEYAAECTLASYAVPKATYVTVIRVKMRNGVEFSGVHVEPVNADGSGLAEGQAEEPFCRFSEGTEIPLEFVRRQVEQDRFYTEASLLADMESRDISAVGSSHDVLSTVKTDGFLSQEVKEILPRLFALGLVEGLDSIGLNLFPESEFHDIAEAFLAAASNNPVTAASAIDYFHKLANDRRKQFQHFHKDVAVIARAIGTKCMLTPVAQTASAAVHNTGQATAGAGTGAIFKVPVTHQRVETTVVVNTAVVKHCLCNKRALLFRIDDHMSSRFGASFFRCANFGESGACSYDEQHYTSLTRGRLHPDSGNANVGASASAASSAHTQPAANRPSTSNAAANFFSELKNDSAPNSQQLDFDSQGSASLVSRSPPSSVRRNRSLSLRSSSAIPGTVAGTAGALTDPRVAAKRRFSDTTAARDSSDNDDDDSSIFTDEGSVSSASELGLKQYARVCLDCEHRGVNDADMNGHFPYAQSVESVVAENGKVSRLFDLDAFIKGHSATSTLHLWLYQCTAPGCHVKAVNKHAVRCHFKSKHVDKGPEYFCKYCGKEFEHAKSVPKHERACGAKTINDEKLAIGQGTRAKRPSVAQDLSELSAFHDDSDSSDAEDGAASVTSKSTSRCQYVRVCYTCGKPGGSDAEMNQHSREAQELRYCVSEDGKFPRSFNLDLFLRSLPKSSTKHIWLYECPVCGKKGRSAESVRCHYIGEHVKKGPEYYCGVCSKEFKSPETAREHEKKCREQLAKSQELHRQ